MTDDAAPVLASYTRSGMVEGVHRGTAVIIDGNGGVLESWGDPDRVVYPRSSNKPFQAAGMVASGLHLPPRLLALAASSHSGETAHLTAVRELLESAGLDESALQTPPDYPLDPVERDAWLAEGRTPSSLAMNCSGKHAAMLATCVRNDWPLDSYRDELHPLQLAIRACLERLAGEPVAHVGVDGCGAPVMAISLAGLARAMSRCVQGEPPSPERRVADAMRAHPDLVGGSRHEATAFMRAVPGLLAKDGAAGVFVVAFGDGRAFAVKIDDGSSRARQVAVVALLVRMGADPAALEAWRRVPTMGSGVPVGELSSTLAD